jgi:hypothetical protein
MHRFTVSVTASYGDDHRLFQILHDMSRPAEVQSRIPWWQTTAADWQISEDGRIPPFRETLTVNYADVEGNDDGQAESFALAIFARESEAAGLPAPETVFCPVLERFESIDSRISPRSLVQ